MAQRFSHFGSQSNITKTLSITSGKGGVGKSTLTANIGYQLSNLGYKVLLIDGDMSMANLDIMFGVRSKKNIYHVLNGENSIEEVLVPLNEKLFLLPGGSGLKELQHLSYEQKRELLSSVSDINTRFDYLIVDTAPGIDENVLYLNSTVSDINVVVTPEPSSIADAYALIKVLNRNQKLDRFSVICNQVRDEAEAMRLFIRLSDVSSKFLNISLDMKGFVLNDPILRRSTLSQQLIVKASPQSASSANIFDICQKMCHQRPAESFEGGLQFFWNQLVGVA